MSELRVGVDAWGTSGPLLHTGMGEYTRRLLEGLAEAPGVIAFAYGAPAEPRPDWLPERATWRTPGTNTPSRLAGIASRLSWVRRRAGADRLGIFHSPAVHVRPRLPPVAGTGCPLVVTVHDLIPLTHYGNRLPPRLRLYYRWNLRRALGAQRVITVSRQSAAEISAWSGSLSAAVEVIAPGVEFAPNPDQGVLRRLGIAGEYVLYAGSYEPRKNLAAALHAMARLSPDVHLVAIVEAGSGHAPAAHEQIARLGLGDRVRLLHGLSDADLRAVYTFAGALLFPSLAEGFGFPPLQAAACGVPVVASDLSVLRETLGTAALFADPHDPGALAAALQRVLAEPALRARLRRAGPPAAARYRWPEAVARHLEVYRRLASEPAVAYA